MEEKRLRNRLETTFPARSENEALARSVAAAFAAQADPTIEELTEIRTAVSEAVSNAVIHAYPEGEGDVNFPAFIAKLKSQGYDGDITIEREISGEQQRLDILEAKEFLESLF